MPRNSTLGTGGTVLLLAGIAGLLTVPTALAFHGAPYTAYGTATEPVTGEVYDAELWWGGGGASGQGTYTLTMYDQDTGALFHQATFPGREQFSNIRFVQEPWCPGTVEFVDYVGVDSLTPLHSDHLDVVPHFFYVEGYQKNCLGSGEAIMVYQGHYLHFELDLVV